MSSKCFVHKKAHNRKLVADDEVVRCLIYVPKLTENIACECYQNSEIGIYQSGRWLYKYFSVGRIIMT